MSAVPIADRDPEATGSADGRGAPSTVALVAALEEDIVLGRLHPRERLVEDDLIARFGASRHQVRQALVELTHMGLVERFPNRGALVRSYTDKEIHCLYALRDLLEAEAARLIPFPVDPIALTELKAIQIRHDRAVSDGDLVELFRSNYAFHRRLFACCGNPFLIEAIEAAALRAHGIRFLPMRNPRNREMSRRQHHAIIEALERQDWDELVRLCRLHLVGLKDAYFHVTDADRN
jgi:DNA-binding GntR family transcriptional regulator